MKILYVSPFIPYPLMRGTNQRVFHFMKSLSKNHDVTLFCLQHDLSESVYKDVFDAFADHVIFVPGRPHQWTQLNQRIFQPIPQTISHWYHPDIEEHLAELVSSEHFDLIFCEDICMTHYFLNIDPNIPVVTDRNRVDYEFLSAKKTFTRGVKNKILFYENHLKLQRFEQAVLKRFPHQVVCSPDDFNFIEQTFNVDSSKIKIVRNGIDPSYFLPQAPPKNNSPIVTFTGAMDYEPNIDALRWYFEDIFPSVIRQVPDMQTYIVGINPGQEIVALGELPGVTVTGRVEDIRPYYAQTDVYICPIRIGGGTRLKIAESLGMGIPTVSTSIGCQGLGLTSGRELLMADTSRFFAEEMVRLLTDSKLAEKLRMQGMDFVSEHLTWDGLGRELDSYLMGILKTKSLVRF